MPSVTLKRPGKAVGRNEMTLGKIYLRLQCRPYLALSQRVYFFWLLNVGRYLFYLSNRLRHTESCATATPADDSAVRVRPFIDQNLAERKQIIQ